MSRDPLDVDLRALEPTWSGAGSPRARDAALDIVDGILGTAAIELRPAAAAPHRTWVARVALVAAVALVVVGVAHAGRVGPPQPADTLAATSRPPMVLPETGAWRITGGDPTARRGFLHFRDRGTTVTLRWRPRDELADLLGRRQRTSGPSSPVTVLGRTGALFDQHDPSFDAVWTVEGHAMELVGVAPRATFLAVLHSMHDVPAAVWRGALPAGLLKDVSAGDVAAAMLVGMPLPAGWSATAVGPLTGEDRYRIGVSVVGAVTCGWLQTLLDALAAGDGSAASDALGALATVHDWPVLRDMDAHGDYPERVWAALDPLTTRSPVPTAVPASAASARRSLECGPRR